MTDDKRIDATSIDGQFDKEKYRFAKKFSGGLSVNMPNFFWDKVVPRILSGDLVIPEGLAAVIRLTASNVNLDSYKFLPEDMTMSEYLFGTNGVPTETKIKGIPTQNQIAQEFFSGEITLQEARQKGKDAVATLNKLNETIKPEAPTELEFGNKADKAMADARDSRKYKESTRKARVFDFDDTLARSKSMVTVTMPFLTGESEMADIVARRIFKDKFKNLPSYKQTYSSLNAEDKLKVLQAIPGKTKKINATEFARDAADLEAQGATFDFSEFSKVIDGEKGPLFEVAKFINDAPGKRDMFVLTARPADSATAIKAFLDGIGLNIPIENITGLGDGKPKAKADWFVEKYAEGYNDFYFADDALKNVKAVKDVFNVLDVKSKVQQARVKFSERLSKDFNDMIERNKGVKSEATFSDLQARRRGRNQKRFSFFVPPSADDFRVTAYATSPFS